MYLLGCRNIKDCSILGSMLEPIEPMKECACNAVKSLSGLRVQGYSR